MALHLNRNGVGACRTHEGAIVSTWALGEYPLMAEHLEPAAIAAVDRADVQARDRVLDVATGTGNAALLAAQRGADVVGVDFEPALLTRARHRSAGLGLMVRWETADATALSVPDGWADVVLSVFGVMYASDQAAAARELARCAAPGARIALASWVPGSFMPAMGNALSTFLTPPPPSSGPPSRSGGPQRSGELDCTTRTGPRLTFDREPDIVLRQYWGHRQFPRAHRGTRTRRARITYRAGSLG